MTTARREETRHLRFDAIAPGRALHAALFAHQCRARGYEITLHDHDFYEMMFVLAGGAEHPVNGAAGVLRPGDLLFLRPADRHAIRLRPREKLHHVNVAFPAAGWQRFRDAAGDLAEAALPTAVSVPEARREACAAVFRRALHDFQRPPSPLQWLDLCRFLSDALPFLLETNGAEDDADHGPPWLVEACRRARRDPDLLRAGLPALAAAAGVSPSHLARTLKAATGATPTQYLNALRLRRAATLLATTPLPILEIAADCGFAQLSYFYRLFGREYGVSPHAYRLRARRAVGA